MKTLQTHPPKTSLVKHAAWLAVLDASCITSTLILIIKNQIPFTARDYTTIIPIPMLLSLVSLLLLVGVFIASILQTKNREGEDELSKLHHLKAGSIAKHVCIAAFVAMLWLIKDFTFAFSGDLMDNLRLPLILFMFAQLVENIAFIILEKGNWE